MRGMQVVAPDILADARGLSVAVSGTGLVLGLLLWLFGGRNYRFWLVLVWTVGAGIVGLQSGVAYGIQPMVAGLLSAVAAGALALALARLVAFASIGACAWVVMHALAPTWNEPLVCFLLGGLIGLLLYRFWMMVLTSVIGTVLAAYSGLCLVDQLGKVDTVAWAEANTQLLNVLCILVAALGVVAQFLVERRRGRKANKPERGSGRSGRSGGQSSPPKKPWWSWGEAA
jgi:hypothetical protein